MFGEMNVVPVVDLRYASEEVGGSLDKAVSRLLDMTEQVKIEKWIQLPRALFVFLVIPGDSESGAFYVYDRRLRVWYWVDFDDDKFGGYSCSDFDRLVRECRFLDLVERPQALMRRTRWIVQLGVRPHEFDATGIPPKLMPGITESSFLPPNTAQLVSKRSLTSNRPLI